MNMKKLKLPLLFALLCSVSACAEQPPIQDLNPTAIEDNSISINPGYVNGSVDSHSADVLTLGEVRNLHKHGTVKISEKQKARQNNIRDRAQEYGLQMGLAYGSKIITDRLNQHAAELNRIYDFTQVAVTNKESGQLMLPPIISERDNTWELSNGGQTLRVANKVYTVDSDATFASNAPIWHSYLFRSYEKPEMPENDSLPSTPEEQDIWNRYSTEAYNKGIHQAVDTLRDDIRSLNHDFVGMWRYHQLVLEGRVTEGFVAVNNMGITGSDNRVNINDRLINITSKPRLNYDHPDRISASVSTESPDEASRTPDINDLTKGLSGE